MEKCERPLREIRRLSNSIRRELQHTANFDFVERVTGANAWIIGYLFENASRDVYQKDVEEECGLSRSTVSGVLSLMENKGLIERASSEEDGRCKRLLLTKRGQEVYALMIEDIASMEERMFRGFSGAEIDTLMCMVGRLRANLDGEPAREKEDEKSC